MKTLLLSAFATLLIACMITSCSKKNENSNITAQDLQDHYIVAAISDLGKQKLAVIYFVKDGSTINAVLDENGLRRSLPLTIQDNKLVYDLNSDGNAVFSFTFKRDNGNIGIASSDFKRANDSQSKIDVVEIIKVSDAPAFDGRVFTYVTPLSDDDIRVGFEAGSKWSYIDFLGASGKFSYYSIGNGIGWKSEDAASGGVSMGVAVPRWNGNGASMLLQSTIHRLDETRIHTATGD